MDRDELVNHRLVGGTALALQIGHRISIDIDLFSDIPSDYTAIEMALFSEFGSEAQILQYKRIRIRNPIAILTYFKSGSAKGEGFFLRIRSAAANFD
jgi:hypothetical protein